jgi:aspartyl protease family protein
MSSFREDRFSEAGVPRSGLLGHSLRLALAVLATGIAVMFLLEQEDAGKAAVSPSSNDGAAPAAQARSPAVAGPVSELVLTAGPHGHFLVNATVNGETLRFMVDTGASSIYLTPQDAARLGWPAHRLVFSERYDTAAGEVRAAPVTLRSLRIGQLELYDLPASVGEAPGSLSLLGMTFLKRLESYQVRGDTLILSW